MFRTNRVRAVIFDLGHTLWDFAPPPYALRLRVLQLYRQLESLVGNAPAPVEIERALNASFTSWARQDGSYVQPPSETLVANALSALGLGLSDEAIDAATRLLLATDLEMPVVEADTLAALAALDTSALAMGCITNTLLLQEGIEDIVERLGLRRYLRCVVVSSAVGFHKPHPALFQRALDDLGVGPAEAVFVGDRLIEDVGGAKALGMRGVLTVQYRQEAREAVEVSPDAVIQRLAELPAVLNHWRGAV